MSMLLEEAQYGANLFYCQGRYWFLLAVGFSTTLETSDTEV